MNVPVVGIADGTSPRDTTRAANCRTLLLLSMCFTFINSFKAEGQYELHCTDKLTESQRG